ncbi:hypothetical protein TNCT_229861 [Trichonephila clavata]|uniref:Uncharacterized protein n=1 Tax=Trichonephila clavata TaxID=2740835 RepID=A0A8X6K4G4_TRICU|nr:hypothetical protein TNCT_229861 [Trichonephila clavata]
MIFNGWYAAVALLRAYQILNIVFRSEDMVKYPQFRDFKGQAEACVKKSALFTIRMDFGSIAPEMPRTESISQNSQDD